MKNSTLSIIAIIGAPFLGLGFYGDLFLAADLAGYWTGLYGVLFITGWMASMELMRRKQMTGASLVGKGLLYTILATLAVANLSNIWQLFAPDYKPDLFWHLDKGWPVSNLIMFVVGVAVLLHTKGKAWQHWVPLSVGCWLPISLLLQSSDAGIHFSSFYSIICWCALALTVRSPHKIDS